MICADREIEYGQSLIPWEEMQLVPEKTRGKKRSSRRKYAAQIGALDIETTNLDEIKQSFIYHWQFQMDGFFTITGRTDDQMADFLRLLDDYLHGLNADLIVFVHNLSFEFQFLSGLFDLSGGRTFAMENRKVLKVDLLRHIELRCSYLQSGRSLDSLCKTYKVFHGKQSGDDFDYRKIRYPWTPLTSTEKLYCLNDVRGLVEAMYARKEERGDTWYSMPYTKTGYIRRRVKRALGYRTQYSRRDQADYEVYQALRRAFRGGNTHANVEYAGRIIDGVSFVDRSSSYPDVMLNCLYPKGAFKKTRPAAFDEMINSGEYAMIADLRLKNVRLKDEFFPVPYLSRDKCRRTVNGRFDNGRIYAADYLETTVTDIDFSILVSEYDFEYDCTGLYYTRYAYLPEELRAIIRDLYVKKTTLKGVEGSETEYALSKEDINSVYGMCVQDPGKPDIEYNGTDFMEDWEDPEGAYLRRIHNTPLLYAWGVWTTAWARLRLEEAIRLVGCRMVYCDTDSVGFVGDIDLTEYNRLRKSESEANGGTAVDPKGKRHWLGVFEPDKKPLQFVTFGAKKYAYTMEDGLHITIAGVNKKKGAEELKEAGGLPALQIGFVFRKGGGTSSIYNDEDFGLYKTENDGIIRIRRNIYIQDSEYTLGLTDDYVELITRTHFCRRTIDQRMYEQIGYIPPYAET